MTTYAQQLEQARDLRRQLSGLGAEDEQEMVFQEWSPGRKLITLWNTQDGSEITIPKYMVGPALSKTRRDGQPMFTAFKENAPVFREGTVRCFLAEGSDERESGLLDAAGLGHLEPCPAEGLRSEFSKEQHAKNRHQQSWATLTDYLNRIEREESRADQRKQTAAMLKLAGGVDEPVSLTCETCSYEAKSLAGLRAHQRSHGS